VLARDLVFDDTSQVFAGHRRLQITVSVSPKVQMYMSRLFQFQASPHAVVELTPPPVASDVEQHDSGMASSSSSSSPVADVIILEQAPGFGGSLVARSFKPKLVPDRRGSEKK
jgi:hypothetical protein